MQELSNAKTKEFIEFFTKKDAVGIDAFTDRNEAYKSIYRLFKGRFYFTEQDNFDFRISQDNKTAALICRLKCITPGEKNSGNNLEIHIARADYNGDFHRTEQIRYDAREDIKFAQLENDAVILFNPAQPMVSLKRQLKPLPRELTLSEEELAEIIMKEAKLKRLQELKEMHQRLGGRTLAPQICVNSIKIASVRARIPSLAPQKLMPCLSTLDKRQIQNEYNYSSVECMTLL